METSEGKRECELKYKIESKLEKIRLIEKIKNLGFKFRSDNLESDYTPDVEGFLCRENGMMLRFRVLEGTQNDVLITLKIKGKGKDFQDNYEIETLFSEFDTEKFNQINDKLFEATKFRIPPQIRDLKSIKEYVDNDGKKITIDEFPGDIGQFLEIETAIPEELYEVVQMLGLDMDNLEKRNYGEIIKEKQKKLPEQERRTCIFNIVEKNEKEK